MGHKTLVAEPNETLHLSRRSEYRLLEDTGVKNVVATNLGDFDSADVVLKNIIETRTLPKGAELLHPNTNEAFPLTRNIAFRLNGKEYVATGVGLLTYERVDGLEILTDRGFPAGTIPEWQKQLGSNSAFGTTVVMPNGEQHHRYNTSRVGIYSEEAIQRKIEKTLEIQALLPSLSVPIAVPNFLATAMFELPDGTQGFAGIYERPLIRWVQDLKFGSEFVSNLPQLEHSFYRSIRALFDKDVIHSQLHEGNRGFTQEGVPYIGDLESIVDVSKHSTRTFTYFFYAKDVEQEMSGSPMPPSRSMTNGKLIPISPKEFAKFSSLFVPIKVSLNMGFNIPKLFLGDEKTLTRYFYSTHVMPIWLGFQGIELSPENIEKEMPHFISKMNELNSYFSYYVLSIVRSRLIACEEGEEFDAGPEVYINMAKMMALLLLKETEGKVLANKKKRRRH